MSVADEEEIIRRLRELEVMLQAGMTTPQEARTHLEMLSAINELTQDTRPLPPTSDPIRQQLVKKFDREILNRISNTLHELMPNVDISIRNAEMDMIQRDAGSFVLPGAKLVEVREIFTLKMEIKFTAADPADFLREAALPKEEVSRVFRMEDGK